MILHKNKAMLMMIMITMSMNAYLLYDIQEPLIFKKKPLTFEKTRPPTILPKIFDRIETARTPTSLLPENLTFEKTLDF